MLRKTLGSIYKFVIRRVAYPYSVYKRLGAYWLLNKCTSMDEAFIKFKPYEEGMIEYASDAIKLRDIDCVYDIGANIGYYSVMLGLMSTVKSVWSFEPLPALHLQVGSNVLINGLVDKWHGFKCALGNRAGTEDIYFHPYWLGTSSLQQGWVGRSKESLSVSVEVFDEIISANGERCFLKIDVEGSEVSVLAGMQRFLRANDVFMQIEAAGENAAIVCQMLERLGYVLVGRPSEVDYYFSNFAIDKRLVGAANSTDRRNTLGKSFSGCFVV